MSVATSGARVDVLNNRLCELAQTGIIARANGPTEAAPKRHVEAKHPSEPSIEGTMESHPAMQRLKPAYVTS